MKKLLLFVFIKSVALITEATIMFAIPDLEEYEKKYLLLATGTEFINWTNTQIIIWLVAMRFYESSLPVKLLELQIMREE